MNTLMQFAARDRKIPTATAWALADLGEFIGRQTLFTKQSPQRLKALREHALIESAVSSNRIEGVEVSQDRVATVVLGKTALRDRDEEEVRGYRNALSLVHGQHQKLRISEPVIRRLHRLARGAIWDAGKYKERDGDIIERYPNGHMRVRFKPTLASQTPRAMKDLLLAWRECLEDRWVHPLIALGAFNLDFLCIHPFRDGNGRASRLLLLLQSYHLGLEVGRYVSLERLIEQNKERYYETLEVSSQGWHEGKHDPWKHDPWKYINFVMFVLKEAYREFEARVSQMTEPRGAKGELVRAAVRRQPGAFRLIDIERACPGVGRDWIRAILREMRIAGQISLSGRGPVARWRFVERRGTTTKKR